MHREMTNYPDKKEMENNSKMNNNNNNHGRVILETKEKVGTKHQQTK